MRTRQAWFKLGKAIRIDEAPYDIEPRSGKGLYYEFQTEPLKEPVKKD